MDAALAHLARPRSPGQAVLVVHSWWGMTESFTDYADRVAGEGFLAGCVDLYGGRLAGTAEEARELRRAPRREPMLRQLGRGIDALLADASCSGEKVAVVGFSMGGHWAVWLAQHDPRVSAVVLYHACRSAPAIDGPPVLAHFAEADAFVTTAGRRRMERSLVRSGRTLEAYDYPVTGHWFAESAHAAYDPAAADLAFVRTVDFLRSHAA